VTAADPPPSRSRFKWWALIFVLLLLFAWTCVFLLYQYVSTPTFDSVDRLDATQVTGMRVFVLNRPDGGPDLGDRKQKGFPVAPGDFDRVLAPLRNARPVHTDRGVWLGQLTVYLADGSRQPIYLYRAQPDPKQPVVLRFTIGSSQYEAGPVDDFVKVLAACEPRPAATGPG